MNDNSNGFTNDSETIEVTPIFDSTSRQAARKVVPLPSAPIETTRTANAPQVQTVPQYAKPEQVIISQPKPESFLKYFLITMLVVFALIAGAAGGFVLARYQNQKEKKGLALIPQPALRKMKGLPELRLEVFEDPNEIQIPEEPTDDETNPSETPTPTPSPSPTPN
jgi:hypothetical protein